MDGRCDGATDVKMVGTSPVRSNLCMSACEWCVFAHFLFTKRFAFYKSYPSLLLLLYGSLSVEGSTWMERWERRRRGEPGESQASGVGGQRDSKGEFLRGY